MSEGKLEVEEFRRVGADDDRLVRVDHGFDPGAFGHCRGGCVGAIDQGEHLDGEARVVLDNPVLGMPSRAYSLTLRSRSVRSLPLPGEMTSITRYSSVPGISRGDSSMVAARATSPGDHECIGLAHARRGAELPFSAAADNCSRVGLCGGNVRRSCRRPAAGAGC